MTSAVLIVEDDPAQLYGLSTILRLAGYEVHGARDGAEALQAGERVRPDAAICDWDLGAGPDGAQVMHALQSVVPGLVSILITADDLDRLRRTTRDMKGVCYFGKPVAPVRLLEALRAAGCEP